MTGSIKSKARVRDQGEVFTAKREVNAMLNLVKNETDRIESRFLEPACGNGNFLAPVFARKLLAVERSYKKSQLEWERNALIALGSVYGIDIMQDNVAECQDRLYNMFEATYTALYKKRANPTILASARAIVGRNILWGDALTLKTSDPQNPQAIVFSKWERPFNDSRIQRKDYDFEEIVARDKKPEKPDLFNQSQGKVADTGEEVYQVHPIKEFPMVHMTKLGELA